MRISWGSVDKDGRAVSGGNSVTKFGTGEYRINFAFSNPKNPPAVVGTQTRSANLTEANTDGIVFPIVSTAAATVNTGNNVGTREDRSFSYIAAGETLDPTVAQPVLWGAVDAQGNTVAGSGGFSVTKRSDKPGMYDLSFTGFTSIPAIVATQTNSGNLTEANTDGIVVPILNGSSATLITGNNRSTPEDRSFSFIAVGDTPHAGEIPYGANSLVWGSINSDGRIVGGSGGFSVGRQGPGMYVITFPAFAKPPAIVGSQTGSLKGNQDNRDGMVFPWVNTHYAIAVTGNASGNQENRSFSFIAIGQPGT